MRLHELGEFGFLARVQATLPTTLPGVVRGSGDDAAVLTCEAPFLLLSTDAMVEGQHFRREWLTLREVGERAARAALSDLAAMGGTPRGLLASVALPPDTEVAAAQGLTEGLEAGAVAAGAHLLGGDLVSSPGPLFLDVTVVGETTECWLRSGARVGDLLLVSGDLGSSAVALGLLETGDLQDGLSDLRERFVRPRPAFDLVAALHPLGVVTAAIDISDGLLADLGHLADSSGVHLQVDAARIPIATPAHRLAYVFERSPLSLALSSGEEYELAFTVSPEALPAVQKALAESGARPVTVIGRVTAGSGVTVEGAELPASPGWDHFSSAAPEADPA